MAEPFTIAPGFAAPKLATSPLNRGPSNDPIPIVKIPTGPPLVETKPKEPVQEPETVLENVGGINVPFPKGNPYHNPYLDQLLTTSPTEVSSSDGKTRANLWERATTDFSYARQNWTLLGAAESAAFPQDPDHTRYDFSIPGDVEAWKRSQEISRSLDRYNAMAPARAPFGLQQLGPLPLVYPTVSPEGVAETAVATAAHILGGMSSPESFIWPQVWIGKAGGAITGMARSAVAGASIALGIDLGVQGLRVAGGLQPDVNPTEVAATVLFGGAFGAALKSGPALGWTAAWIRSWINQGEPPGEVLSILRGAGHTDAEIKGWSNPQRVEAFAKAQGLDPEAVANAAGVVLPGKVAPNPFLTPAENAARQAAPPVRVITTPEDAKIVQEAVDQAVADRRATLEAQGEPAPVIAEAEAAFRTELAAKMDQAVILERSGVPRDRIAAMTADERDLAVAEAQAPVPPAPPRAATPEVAPEVAADVVAPPAAAVPGAPVVPPERVSHVSGKTVQFPDEEHAALFDAGALLSQGKALDPDATTDLVNAFIGVIDPKEGIGPAAIRYFNAVAGKSAAEGGVDTVQAGTAFIQAEARTQWDAFQRQKQLRAERAADTKVQEARAGAGLVPDPPPGGLKPVMPFKDDIPPTGERARAGVFLFDPNDLKFDAATFQFKDAGDAQGVTPLLKGVTKWDPDAAGQIMVFQALDGTTFVADGHQRVSLAQRLDQDIMIPGSLYRAADGFTAEDVMVLAALKNIREGSGSIMDAAKILRRTPDDINRIAEVGREQTRQAVALTKLSNDVWRMAINKVINPQDAAIIGRVIPQDQELQFAAAQAITKLRPETALDTELLVNRVKQADLVRAEQGAQTDLLGELTRPESTAGEEISIVGRTIKTLSQDKNTLRRVARNAERIERTGSRIARTETAAAADEAANLVQIVQKVAFSRGAPRTALIELAKEIKDGRRSLNDAVEAFIVALRGEDRVGDTGGSAVSGRGPGDEAASTSLFGADRIGPAPIAPGPRVAIGTGTELISQSGRQLSPAPEIDLTTKSAARATLKRVDRWLHSEAVKEADHVGDDVGYEMVLSIDPKKMNQGDRDTLNNYLFGTAEGVTRTNLVGGEPRSAIAAMTVMEPPSEQAYVSQALRNLKATSRTAQGVVDTSSSAGKADKIVAGLTGEQAASRATANVEAAIRQAYETRFETPTVASIYALAARVNEGIVKPGALARTLETKYQQTLVKDLRAAEDQFAEEFARRLADPAADPVETAAWVEWRVNLNDHFWSDGVGKTAKVLAAIPLMRAGLPLPNLPKPSFELAPKTRLFDAAKGGAAYLNDEWQKFLGWYRSLSPHISEQGGLNEANIGAGRGAGSALPDAEAGRLPGSERVPGGDGAAQSPLARIDAVRRGPGAAGAEAAQRGGGPGGGRGDGQGSPSPSRGGNAPPVRSDGRVGLTHFSPEPRQVIDPAKQGTGRNRGMERKRTNRLPRSYYGIDVGNPGGYRREPLLGDVRHEASIEPGDLYNWSEDPLGLKAKTARGGGLTYDEAERAVRDAGFKGYWVDHKEMGKVAAVFEPLTPEMILGARGEQIAVLPKDLPPSPTELGDTVPMLGLPGKVTVPGRGPMEFKPFPPARIAARAYMAAAGLPYNPPSEYVKVVPARATKIADAYEAMKHDPENPEVKASYAAMIKETLDQYQEIKKTGLKIEFIEPGQPDPYALSPRYAQLDVTENNHLWVFPTDQGFGSGAELKGWMAGSKAVDKDGAPLLVFRGEHGSTTGTDFQSRLPSLSFGSKKAAETYAKEPNNRTLDKVAVSPRVIPAYVSIKKPIFNDPTDPFVDLKTVQAALGEQATIKIAVKHSASIMQTDNWRENFASEYGSVKEVADLAPDRLGELYLDAYQLLDDQEFVAAAKAKGFDGAIHGGNGETALDVEYKVFDPKQARRADDFKRADPGAHPMLAETTEKIGDRTLLANDVFRIVHDYFGHFKEGVGFRSDGEENAWMSHSAMYSALARKAMTAETRGQNSWVNYGPHGKANRDATAAQTVFADQKAGLLPDWANVPEQPRAFAEPITSAALAARKAEQPLVPKRDQTNDVGPLFSHEGQQLDLVDLARAAGEPVSFADRILATSVARNPAVRGPDGSTYRIRKSSEGYVGMKFGDGDPTMINPPSGRVWTAEQARDAVVEAAGAKPFNYGKGGAEHAMTGAAVEHGFVTEAGFKVPRTHPLMVDLEAKIAARVRPQDLAKHPLVVMAEEAANQIPLTHAHPEFNKPEWWSSRRFIDPTTGKEIVGLGKAWPKMMRKFLGLGWEDDGMKPQAVLHEHDATIILGPPAAGKSTIANPIARARRAAIVDSDEINKFLPESQGGLGNHATHDEASEITKKLTSTLTDRGTNLVLPKIGSSQGSITRLVNQLSLAGYKVKLVNVLVDEDEAFRRMIKRFVATGKLINTTYAIAVDGGPHKTYVNLKGERIANGYAAVDASGPIGSARVVEDDGGVLAGVDFARNPRAAGAEGSGAGADAAGGSNLAQRPGGADLGGGGPGGRERTGDVRGVGPPRRAGGGAGGNRGEHGFTVGGAADEAEHAFVGILKGTPFRGERGRPDAGIPAGAANPPPTVRLKEISERVTAALGIAVRQGRFKQGMGGGKKRLGIFNEDTGIVRLGEQDAFDVLIHEGGHALHLNPKNTADLDAIIANFPHEIENMAYPGAPPDRLRSEGFAEFFRLWVSNRPYVEKNTPNFLGAFESYMAASHPKMLKELEIARTAYDDWSNGSSVQVVTGDLVTSAVPPLRTRIGKALKNDRLPTGETLMTFMGRFYTRTTASLHPINRAVRVGVKLASELTGKPIDLKAVDDAHQLARLATNSYQAGHIDLAHGVVPHHGGPDGNQVTSVGPSLISALELAAGKNWYGAWRADDMLDFGGYLVARRSVFEWGRKQRGEVPNPPGKLSKGEYEQAVRDYEKAHPSFPKAAELIYQWQNNFLKKKLDAGLITQSFYDFVTTSKADYVPFQRDFATETESMLQAASKAGNNKASIMKTYRGSMRSIVNPIESIISDAYATAALIARNDTVRALDRLARMAGPSGGAIFERIPATALRAQKFDLMDAIRLAGKQANANPDDINTLVLSASEILDSESFMTTMFKAGEIHEKGEPIVYFWDGGVRHAGRLPDGRFGKMMFEALTQIGVEQANWITHWLAVPATVLRAGITTHPAFLVANYVRDQTAASVLNNKFIPFASGAKGAWNEIRQKETSRLAAQSGMIMGGAQVASLDQTRIGRSLAALQKKGYSFQRLRDPRELLKLTEISETGTRLALFDQYYKTGLKNGLSKYEAAMEAAYEARDFMDFGRHGSRMLGIRRIITFFNAALQGTDKVLRTLGPDMLVPMAKMIRGEALNARDKAHLARSAGAWVKIGALTMLSATYAALHIEDPEFQEASEYLRATNWLVKLPGGDWAVIPKPYEMATILNFGERLAEGLAANDPTWVERWVRSWQNTLSLPLEPAGLLVPVELITNRDTFRDAPIVPEWQLGLEPSEQFNNYTSEFSRAVGKTINMSPSVIDHMMVGFGGSWARDFLNVSNLVDPQRRSKALYDWPITSRFVKNLSRGSDATDKFYGLVSETTGRLERKLNTYQKFVKAGNENEAANFYARMKDDEKVWVASQLADTVMEKRTHPLRRASDVVGVISGLQRDILSRHVIAAIGSKEIVLNPSTATELNDQLARAAAAETRNGLITIGVPGWAGREIIDPRDFLKAVEMIDPRIAKELDDRLWKAKVQSFSGVAAVWPSYKTRLLQDGPGTFLSDLSAAASVGGASSAKPASSAPVFMPTR